MRGFNANFSAALSEAGHAPVTLVEFRFATGDVHVSDRAVTPSDGPAFMPVVVSWKGIGPPSTGPYGIGLPQAELELLDDGSPGFGALLRSNVPEKTLVDMYQWFEGTDYADREQLGRFVIATPIRYDGGRVRLGLVSAFVLNNRTLADPITTDEFPDADPDDVGESKPIVYGSVEGLPCRAIDAGGLCRLADDITVSATSIEVSRPAGSPGFPDAPFTVQAGAERMRVTAVDGDTWTVTRGYSGTEAADHKAGRAVYEIRSSYRYLVAGHPVKSIGDVYVDGVRAISGVTRNADDSGIATVEFSDRPVFEKSVGLAVTDGIDVDDPGHSHGLGHNITKVYGTSDGESKPSGWITTGNRSSIDDSVEDGACYRLDADGKSGQGYLRVSFPTWNGPAPVSVKLCCRYMWYTSGSPDSALYVRLGTSSYGGTSLAINSPNPSDAKVSNGTSYPSNVYFSMKNDGSACWADVYEIWLEVTTDATVSAGAGVSKSGTVSLTGDSAADYVVGRRVTCDLEGAADDSSGTYTGTPNALVENPADVLKHLLCEHMGMPVSEAGSSFTAVRASLDDATSEGYRFAGAVDSQTDAFDLVEDICSQARMRLYHDGTGARLSFIEDAPGTPVMTLTGSMVFAGGLDVSHAGRDEVINRLAVRYNRDMKKSAGSPDGYLGAIGSSTAYPAAGDLDSVADYGPRWPRRPMMLSFIPDEESASDIRDLTITRFKDAARRVTLTGLIELLTLERGDVVGFGQDLAGYGLAGALFEVERTVFTPGSHRASRPDTVAVTAREVG